MRAQFRDKENIFPVCDNTRNERSINEIYSRQGQFLPQTKCTWPNCSISDIFVYFDSCLSSWQKNFFYNLFLLWHKGSTEKNAQNLEVLFIEKLWGKQPCDHTKVREGVLLSHRSPFLYTVSAHNPEVCGDWVPV